MNVMTISELAKATGVSVHTLRYYDGLGLIPSVQRNEAGHRRFHPDHVRWIGLLDRLRTSGMSIARMRDYAELAVRGDATAEARADLLRTHRDEIRDRVAELQGCLAIVDAKIDLYEGRESDPRIVWELVEEARGGGRPVPGSTGVRSG